MRIGRGARTASLAALVVAAAPAACGVTKPPPDDDIDGAAAYVGEVAQRIGDVDDPERGFSRITQVAVAADGTLFVGEAQDLQIRVYTPDGELLRSMGRRGGGPGEFQGMPQFGVHQDTVWTYDLSAGRITLFDRDGRVLSTGPTRGEPIRLADGRQVWVTPLRMRADGRFISEVMRITYSRDADASGLDPDTPFRVPRLLFDASGAVVDTAGWDATPPPRMVPPPGHESEYRTISAGGRNFEVPAHGSTLPLWVALDDGRIIVEQPAATDAASGAVHVTRLGLALDTVWRRTFHYRPAPYDAAELDSAAARSARGANIISGGPPVPTPGEIEPIIRQIRAAMQWPPYRQPFVSAWLAQDGAVWLARSVRPGDAASWFVIEPDGAGRGNVELPPRARIVWARGDTAWAAVPDELDVPWLVRYRLRR